MFRFKRSTFEGTIEKKSFNLPFISYKRLISFVYIEYLSVCLREREGEREKEKEQRERERDGETEKQLKNTECTGKGVRAR